MFIEAPKGKSPPISWLVPLKHGQLMYKHPTKPGQLYVLSVSGVFQVDDCLKISLCNKKSALSSVNLAELSLTALATKCSNDRVRLMCSEVSVLRAKAVIKW